MMKYYQKTKRTFEKSGLVIPEQSFHVYLENVTNTDNEDIRTMIDKGRYFTIFAPRQSGKTTFFFNFCRSLYHRLKQENLTPWLDEIDIFPGQNWDIEIQRAIKKTDFALICLSSISVQKKGYLHKEIKWALDRQSEMPEGDIFVIPVKIEPCKLEDRLSGIHSVDLFEASGFEKLIQSIRYQVQKNGKEVKGQNKDLQQPNDLIQQLKQGINKLSLNSHEKEYINLQINILETQFKSSQKHSSVFKAVMETIHQLIKDTADNDLMKVMDQIKRVME